MLRCATKHHLAESTLRVDILSKNHHSEMMVLPSEVDLAYLENALEMEVP